MSATWDSTLVCQVDARVSDEATGGAALKTLDDRGLAVAARGGSVEAFEELVRRYRNDVFALANHYLRNREEAWDASQEVFVKAHRALRRFRGDSSFKTWILRITANHCKDVIKKRKLRTVGLEASGAAERVRHPAPGPAEIAAGKEIGIALQESLDALSPNHRLAIVLRELEGMSYQEMADVMGCSMGTVMSRLHHARKKLQHLLIDAGVVEGVYNEN